MEQYKPIVSTLPTVQTVDTEEEDELFDLSVPHISRSDIQNIIGMRPKNIDLYRRAFVHKSLQKHVKNSELLNLNVQEYMKESFERLEFVGDAVLNLVVANMLYGLYPDKDEGFLTRVRTKIVRGTNCCKLSKKLGLGRWILTGTKIVRIKDASGAVINERLLEDVFESLIGAIYLDLGFSYAESFLLKLIKEHIDISSLTSLDDNYKDILMRYTQINSFELPIYETKEISGPPHSRVFTVTMSLKKNGSGTGSGTGSGSNNNLNKVCEYGIGQGPTKKEAEQNACKDSICFKRLQECDIHTCNSNKIHLNEIENLMNRDVQ